MGEYIFNKNDIGIGSKGFIVENRFVNAVDNFLILNLNKLKNKPDYFFDFEEETSLVQNQGGISYGKGYYSNNAPIFEWSTSKYIKLDITSDFKNFNSICLGCFIKATNKNTYQYILDFSRNSDTRIEFAVTGEYKAHLGIKYSSGTWMKDINSEYHLIENEWNYMSTYYNNDQRLGFVCLNGYFNQINMENSWNDTKTYNEIRIGLRKSNTEYRLEGQVDNLMMWKNIEWTFDEFKEIMNKISKSKKFIM